ncbi:MAG: DegT/DnrJ/EryC1/StrS family aminotransferase [Deltaproteobacteria bacterium]|nr:DegT/DnrJ/EryC1/StrS family aminotransferase [Deltaproteobacteria bacterium]
MSVPMCEPDITDVEREAVADVLRTPVLALGPRLEAFERALARFAGLRHAVGVNSGTSGLHLCMIAAGVEEGDVVVTTPFSFVASANCVLYQRARPDFVDIEPASLGIDPEALADRVETLVRGGARVKAILPVHVFGQPCDMDPILEVAQRFGLAVLEDACEAIGAAYRGKPVGTLGHAGVFAFYPNKQMTTGEGGAIVTNETAWATLFQSLRNQGRDVFDGWLEHSRLGFNYRLDEMSAALGLAQLGRIDELLAGRERVARWYDERLSGLDGVELPSPAPWTTRMSWFVYVIRLEDGARRDRVIRDLAARGIASRPYFPPIHLQPVYRERFGHRRGDFPRAEEAGERCLALPFFGRMRESQVDEVCEALREVLAGAAGTRFGESSLPASA